MKRTYVKPVAEKIEFDYKDQVVAASREVGTHYTDGKGHCDCGYTVSAGGAVGSN